MVPMMLARLIGPDSGVWWMLAAIVGVGIVLVITTIAEIRAEREEQAIERNDAGVIPFPMERRREDIEDEP